MIDARTWERLRRIERAIGESQLAEFNDEKLAELAAKKEYPTEKTVDWRLFKLEQRREEGGCFIVFLAMWVAFMFAPSVMGWWYSEASPAKYAEAEVLAGSDEHRHFVEAAMKDGEMTNGEFFWMWPVARKEASAPARESLNKRLYKP